MRRLTRSIVAVFAAATLSAGMFAAPATAAPAGGAGASTGKVLGMGKLDGPGMVVGASYRLAFWHSSKCLDVIGNSTANGAAVGQWDCGTAAANQTWTVERVNDDPREFRLRVAHSKKCLDLVGNSKANGAAFGQWDCNTGRNQTFRFGTPVWAAGSSRCSTRPSASTSSVSPPTTARP